MDCALDIKSKGPGFDPQMGLFDYFWENELHHTFIFIIDFAYRIHVAKWFHCTVSSIIKVPLVDSPTLSPKVLDSTPRWDDLLIFWKMNCNIHFLIKLTLLIAWMQPNGFNAQLVPLSKSH